MLCVWAVWGFSLDSLQSSVSSRLHPEVFPTGFPAGKLSVWGFTETGGVLRRNTVRQEEMGYVALDFEEELKEKEFETLGGRSAGFRRLDSCGISSGFLVVFFWFSGFLVSGGFLVVYRGKRIIKQIMEKWYEKHLGNNGNML